MAGGVGLENFGLPEMVVAQFWHARDHEDPAHIWLRSTLASAET
jgi:hypothetical protein